MKRIALLSDIHANLPALEAVMLDLELRKVDQVLCLGDLVGYGAFPSSCIRLIKEMDIPTVLGNHDAGVAKNLTSRHFREPNRSLIIKTRDLLDHDLVDWLKNLPFTLEGAIDSNVFWIAAHASPITPEKWGYIDSALIAREVLKQIQKNFVFVGHTHVPCIVSEEFGQVSLDPDKKYLLNPGSIGQPRDNDYRASYGILDLNDWRYDIVRVEYEIEKTLRGLTDLGYSRSQAHQLFGH